eukprot:TRINITY_DN6087_c0_g1_i1.p1 TRINITY_DN6087_c0_g1~~TRINITY_DN6087_c0_g1_i1.p1  ORF type:complete len:169 (-),score=17.36 TRINITY_DN6087_c0_g1_i1:31-537(-)
MEALPPIITPSPRVTEPAKPLCPAIIQDRPNTQLCAIWTKLSILHPSPTIVELNFPRSTQELAPIFNIIADYNIPYLGYFHQTPTVLTWSIAKPIRPNTHIGMENTIIPNNAALPNNGTRPNYGMMANSTLVKNGHVGIKDYPISQNYIFTHITTCSNLTTFTQTAVS